VPSARPLRVGLTGGIACGKSTVAATLADCGAAVVDADAVAHEVTAPGGAAFDEVVARFGRELLDEGGRIDRARLGRIVFADEAARRELEAMVHPHVRRESRRRLDQQARRLGARVAVLEAALLVETGAWREFDRLVVVACSRRVQIERIVGRDGLDETEAQRRIDAQAPLARKTALADHVIETDGPIERTRQRAREVYAALLAEAGSADAGSGGLA